MYAGQILYPILSPLVDDKVYPLIVPETASNTPPYVVYTPISAVAEQTFDGHSGDEWVRVQTDIYHKDYDKLLTLSATIIQTLNQALSLKVFSNNSQSIDDGLFRISLDVEFWQTI